MYYGCIYVSENGDLSDGQKKNGRELSKVELATFSHYKLQYSKRVNRRAVISKLTCEWQASWAETENLARVAYKF